MERLPFEDILYFGDTARVPYGVKSAETITGYARQITEFLLLRNVKLLIIACNTMAAVAYEAVASLSPVPVLDVIDAGARAAVSVTRTKAIGVIGTPATINSNAYTRAIHSHDREIRVFSQACPLFVPLVEEGWFDHPVTRLTADEYLKPVLAEQIDTLVLGCTHYPLLKGLLQKAVDRDPAHRFSRSDGRHHGESACRRRPGKSTAEVARLSLFCHGCPLPFSDDRRAHPRTDALPCGNREMVSSWQ